MSKKKNDVYLELLFAQHPDWRGEDAEYTLCLYVAFGSFNGCKGCWRLKDCCAYHVSEMRDKYAALHELVQWWRKKRAKAKTGKTLNWDVLLERIGQEAKLEIDNYLSEKLDRQIKESGRKKKPTSSCSRKDENGKSPRN